MSEKMVTIFVDEYPRRCPESKVPQVLEQIEQLNKRIKAIQESENEDGELQERLATIQSTIDNRELNRNAYDDSIVRQMIECIKVFKDGTLKIIFGGGYEVEVNLNDTD